MMSGHLFLCKSSRSSSLLKPLTSYLYYPIKLCSCQASDKQGNSKVREFVEERAPSTAQVFKRVEEEKLKETKQGGFQSETVEQATEEATYGDSSKVGSVKERYKKHGEGQRKD